MMKVINVKKLLMLSVFLFSLLIYAPNMWKLVQANEIEPLDSSIYIAVIGKSQVPFWQAVKAGVEKASKDYGVQATYEAPQSEQPDDVNIQLFLLKEALAKNPKAIVLAAYDPKSVSPYLEEAQKAGIPVIGFDTGVDSPIVRTTVASDNYGAGELIAHKMAHTIGKTGKVGIIVPNQISRNIVDRRDGFINTLKENYPDIEVLPVQDSQGNFDVAAELSKSLIVANPDIKGMVGVTPGVSAAVIDVIRDQNLAGQIKVIGFDSGKVLVDAIREGVAIGAITQDPKSLGYKSIETAIRAYKGERLPEFIDVGFVWYDKSNLDDPDIQSLFFE